MPENEHHGHHHHNHSVDECIEVCLACYTHVMAGMHHCLRTGGAHVEEKHLRVMMACAEMCRSAAHIMMTGYDGHASVRAACAEICERCAASCRHLDGMADCVKACRACAHICQDMH